MAGSQKEFSVAYPFTDSILAARLEAIKQLVGGSTDRVAVLDRDFNVIYANESAWSEDAPRWLSSHQAKCYEAFAHRSDPCVSIRARLRPV
jgi:two-component system, NtrC family, response regulator HydG